MLISNAYRRVTAFALSVALCGTICGCAASGMQNVTKESYLQKPAGHVLVTGRLKLKERGVLGKLTSNYPTMVFAPPPGSSIDGKDLFHTTKYNDYFCLLMAPGEYKIVQVHSRFSGLGYQGSLVIPTDLPVSVPPVQAVYIGSIVLEWEHKTKLLEMRQWVENKITVEDKFEEDEKVLREDFPFLPPEIIRSVRSQ